MNLRSLAYGLIFVFSHYFSWVSAQYSLQVTLMDSRTGKVVPDVTVRLMPENQETVTDTRGFFTFLDLAPGSKQLFAQSDLFATQALPVDLGGDLSLEWKIDSVAFQMQTVQIDGGVDGPGTLRAVEGMAIYAARKTELIQMDQLTCNLAANNPRQIFARVAGLNIWESDGGGLQLGIGGRGLSPNRTANFNTRQNGYDMAADALGYPESYYSPPAEALQRIEVVRGAASLQYGTQFGGMLNFVMKEAPANKKLEVLSRQTGGSFGFFNSFNRLSGTVGRLSYNVFYQGKRGDGWRPNSGFRQHTAFAALSFQARANLNLGVEYTRMDYLAQQPGGLTDALFSQDPRQSIRERNWFDVDWNLASLKVDWQASTRVRILTKVFGLHAGRSALGFLGSISRIDPGGARDLLSGRFQNLGAESRAMYKYSLFGRPATLLTGLRVYAGRSTNQQGKGPDGTGPDFQFDTGDGLPDLSNHVFPSENHAFFVENLFPLGNRLSITPGLRFEYIRTRSQGTYTQRVTDLAGNVLSEQTFEDNQDRKRSLMLAGVGIGYRIMDQLEAYANISQNYRAITFNDLRVANPNFRIDPDLQDERGFTADLGFRGKPLDWLELDFSAFALIYNNRIGQVLAVDTSTFQNYRYRTNVAASRTLGLESFIEMDVWQAIKGSKTSMGWVVFANLALIDARYVDAKEPIFNGKMVELVPPLSAKGGLAFRRGGFRANLQYGWTANQYSDATNAVFSANAVEGLIPAYGVMDLSLSMERKFVKLEAGLNNVLNESYFTRRAVAYPGPGIIPADGRSAYLTIQVKI
jgi:Fe(3+) dicitrate transport protein